MQQLVEKLKSGDQQAFVEIYERFSTSIYNTCYRLLGNTSDADDMLQEVFIKVFQNVESVQQAERFESWLKRIAINTCLNAINQKRKLQFLEIDENHGIGMSEEVQLDEESHAAIIEKINQSIPLLPDQYKIIFCLYAIENYTHEQIAQQLGIQASTSRSQYMRAKRKLLELINQTHYA